MNKTVYYCVLALIFFVTAIKSYVGSKNLRPLFEEYDIGIYNQGERVTCSVFAVTGLIEFEYAHTMRQAVTPLSVEFLNWASNKITGDTADGSYFSDAIEAVNKYGICENDLFPYCVQNFNNKVEPSATALKDAEKRSAVTAIWIKDWDTSTGMSDDQIAQVKNQIMDEHPVAIGFRWPKKDDEYWKMDNGIMIVPPEEGVFDGHSVIIMGFEDDPENIGEGYFIFKNSHGDEFGDKGYGKMPYEYVRKYANDGLVIYINQ